MTQQMPSNIEVRMKPPKTITHADGRKFKLGRHRPDAIWQLPANRVRAGDFIGTSKLPQYPAEQDYTRKALTGLDMILGNDVLGDCTSASVMHIEGVWKINAGLPPAQAFPTLAQTIWFYSVSTGYIPGDPSTDQGGNEIKVLQTWRNSGAFQGGRGKIAAWMNVNALNLDEVKEVTYLFENCYAGVELPDAWVDNMPEKSGFLWDVAGEANPDNGHAFPILGYNKEGFIISTWGMLGIITPRAVEKYMSTAGAGELYCAVSVDSINVATKKSPTGFAYADMITYFQQLHGGGYHPTPPAPAPAPTA